MESHRTCGILTPIESVLCVCVCVFSGGGREGATDEQREKQPTELKFSFCPQGKTGMHYLHNVACIPMYDDFCQYVVSVHPH